MSEATENTQNTEQEQKPEEKKDEKKKRKFGTGAIVSIVSVSVVGLLGIGYFYTWPNYQHVEDNNKTIDSKNSEIEQKQAELEDLKQQNKKIAEMTPEELEFHLTPEEKELRKKLPTTIDVPDLIRDMDAYAKMGAEKDEKVFLQGFTFSNPKPDKEHNVNILGISATLSSNAFSLMDYLKELESQEHRIINVKSIDISYNERDFDEIAPIFPSDAKNKEYYNLLKKRTFFLLNDEESTRLKELQDEIFKKYEETKGTITDEKELDTYGVLIDEIEKIQEETSYSINMETYFHMTDAEAAALDPKKK